MVAAGVDRRRLHLVAGTTCIVNEVDSYEIRCPYCWEAVTVLVEHSAGDQQEYTEDCQVCCQPILFRISIEGDEVQIEVRPENY